MSVFQETKYVIKTGTDLVVGNNGINHEFIKEIASQALILREERVGVIIVTSGAVKLGRILSASEGLYGISKQEAAFRGFDPLIQAWQKCFTSIGLHSTSLSLTGQDFTPKNFTRLKKIIKSTPISMATIVNTHDGYNSKRFKYFSDANNNDVVGARLARLCTGKHIICTNTDGVFDKTGKTIRNFTNLEQLNDIVFYQDEQSSGTGGMETKLQTAIQFSLSGETVYIVNGREQDVLLKIHRGEKVGTRVQLQRENEYEK